MAYALFDFDDGDGHLMAGYRYAGWRAFMDGKPNALDQQRSIFEESYTSGYNAAALKDAEEKVAAARALAAKLKARQV